jgi:hypothetical protein
MATAHYTRGTPLAVQGEGAHTTHERSSLSSRAEAVGRELARYGLVVVVGWIGLMKFTGTRRKRFARLSATVRY